MRKKQKIRILLFLFAGMLILSCNYYDEISTKSTESSAENYKLKKVSLIEYSKNTKLFKQINSIKSKNLKSYDSNGKIVYSSDNSFNINTDFATYIENNGNHSYTFKINRDNPQYLLENLILNSNDSLGYDAYIVQYDINESELQLLNNNNFVNLSDKMTLLKLLNSNIVDNIFSKEETVEIQTMCLNSLTVCASGDHFGANGASGNLSYCTIPHTIVTVYAWSECSISIPIGGGGGSTGGTGGGGSPGTGTGSTYDGSDPNIHGNGGISTFPTLDDDFEEEETPCEQLKKLSNTNNQNINPRIAELKTKVINGEINEWGSEFSQQNSYNSTTNVTSTVYSTNIKEGIGGEVTLQAGTIDDDGTLVRYKGGIHTHPLVGGYSMFSWGDVKSLWTMYEYGVSYIKEEVTLMLVCNNPADANNPFVYAIKVHDFNALTIKLDADWNNPDYAGLSDKKKKEKIFDKLSVGYETNKSNLEKHFLQFYADYGISLYKAENDMSNWNKLTLDTGIGTLQQVIPTPCSK